MPILFQKGILCTSNYNDMEHKPAIDGVELNENTTKNDLDLATALVYRGQVATYADLPTTGLKNGDIYNVEDTGINYAWNGSSWDDLGGKSHVSTFKQLGITVANTTIEAIVAAVIAKGLPGGSIIISDVALTNFPINTMTKANLVVQILDGTAANTKFIHLTLTDTNTVPYVWSAEFNANDVPSPIIWVQTGSIPAAVIKRFV